MLSCSLMPWSLDRLSSCSLMPCDLRPLAYRCHDRCRSCAPAHPLLSIDARVVAQVSAPMQTNCSPNDGLAALWLPSSPVRRIFQHVLVWCTVRDDLVQGGVQTRDRRKRHVQPRQHLLQILPGRLAGDLVCKIKLLNAAASAATCEPCPNARNRSTTSILAPERRSRTRQAATLANRPRAPP